MPNAGYIIATLLLDVMLDVPLFWPLCIGSFCRSDTSYPAMQVDPRDPLLVQRLPLLKAFLTKGKIEWGSLSIEDCLRAARALCLNKVGPGNGFCIESSRRDYPSRPGKQMGAIYPRLAVYQRPCPRRRSSRVLEARPAKSL